MPGEEKGRDITDRVTLPSPPAEAYVPPYYLEVSEKKTSLKIPAAFP